MTKDEGGLHNSKADVETNEGRSQMNEESIYLRVKRADLERILAVVERLERGIG